MEIGIPLTPRSPKPSILEPTDVIRGRSGVWETWHTIGDYGDSCLTLVFPTIQNLGNPALILDGDVLKQSGQ